MIHSAFESTCSLSEWLKKLFSCPEMATMGHGQSAEELNLGLGWIYYGLARLIEGRNAVVIGSFRGFVPLVLGRALMDNGRGGQVIFVDPSCVDDFWIDPAQVERHFASFGVSNIGHFRATTQEFVKSESYRGLSDVGLLFVDGYHTEEQARFDHEAFAEKLAPNGFAVFHDSIRVRSSGIYGEDRRFEHTVVRYLDQLKRNPDFQVFDLMFADGASIVRRSHEAPPYLP